MEESNHISIHQVTWIQAQRFNLIQSLIHVQAKDIQKDDLKAAQNTKPNLEKSLKSLNLKLILEAFPKQKLHTTLLLDVHWIYWNQNQALRPPK